MASSNITYANSYNYTNPLTGQVQSASNPGAWGGKSGSVSGTQSSTGLSFADVYKSKAKNLGAPQSMDSIFAEASEKYGVPLALLKAVAKAESGFNASAVSPAGAMGVMQLMPSTASSLGVTDPFDARSNIMGGAKLLSQNLKRYNGNIDLALAAYNAGSGNVAKYGGVPPFAETQNYIKKIHKYMGMDLTAGQVVQGQAYGANSAYGSYGSYGESTGSIGEIVLSDDAQEVMKIAAQYMVENMQFHMQDQVNSLAFSLEEEEEENL